MVELNADLLSRLKTAMPDDPELGVIGKFYECAFLLQSGDRRYLCRVRKGQIEELLVDPHPVEAWHFALKAPEQTWAQFLQDPPPPEFNDIWAAAWLGHMTLEGDMKVFMQHHRALWRTLKLLRETATQAQPA